MREFIHNHKGLVGAGGAVGLALVAFLAFGVFGIHTAFVDNEVSEAGPIFASGASVTEPAAGQEDEATLGSEDPEPAEMIEPESTGDEPVEPVVQTLFSGMFLDSSIHSGTGDAVILTDGTETFLRFEENFATDNGPDLNVYLRANDGSGEFIDLGDLKGNIGSQNYQIPAGTDLSRFGVVDVWCVRFGVSFTEAQLA
jgi:hypothetical protein